MKVILSQNDINVLIRRHVKIAVELRDDKFHVSYYRIPVFDLIMQPAEWHSMTDGSYIIELSIDRFYLPKGLTYYAVRKMLNTLPYFDIIDDSSLNVHLNKISDFAQILSSYHLLDIRIEENNVCCHFTFK